MSSGSRILIDEIVLPDVNVHWHAAMGDISMGILFSGKERTRKQWEALVAQSGLRLAQIQTYSGLMYNSIIVLELQWMDLVGGTCCVDQWDDSLLQNDSFVIRFVGRAPLQECRPVLPRMIFEGFRPVRSLLYLVPCLRDLDHLWNLSSSPRRSPWLPQAA